MGGRHTESRRLSELLFVALVGLTLIVSGVTRSLRPLEAALSLGVTSAFAHRAPPVPDGGSLEDWGANLASATEACVRSSAPSVEPPTRGARVSDAVDGAAVCPRWAPTLLDARVGTVGPPASPGLAFAPRSRFRTPPHARGPPQHGV